MTIVEQPPFSTAVDVGEQHLYLSGIVEDADKANLGWRVILNGKETIYTMDAEPLPDNPHIEGREWSYPINIEDSGNGYGMLSVERWEREGTNPKGVLWQHTLCYFDPRAQ